MGDDTDIAALAVLIGAAAEGQSLVDADVLDSEGARFLDEANADVVVQEVAFAVGTVLPLLASPVVAHPFDRIFAVPVGLALAWLGYALWSERREPAAELAPGTESPLLRPSAAE